MDIFARDGNACNVLRHIATSFFRCYNVLSIWNNILT